MRAMSTRLLTPQMARLLGNIRRANRPPFYAMTVPQARDAYIAASEVLELPRAVLARVEDIRLPAVDGTPLAARLYAPSNQTLPILLYFHGGGFTIGSLETHDSLCRQLALRSHVAVIALEYRLAPEHRFPCAVNDCWSAMQWLITPGTAARADTDSHRRFASGFLLEAAGIAWFFDHYIDHHQRSDWRFAPSTPKILKAWRRPV